MDETDGKLISSTNSSVDSGLDNDYLSDNNSSISNGELSRQLCVLDGIFNVKTKLLVKDSKHLCVLNFYDISRRGIGNISPRTFQYMTYCVTELNLSSNNLENLPETICLLENLEKMDLSRNKIQNIPDSWKTLCKLKVLKLFCNELKVIPKCLETGMDRLTHIDLSHNKLSNFVKPPRCLYFLQYLNLSHNSFLSLPVWLFTEQCRSLEELDMSYNFCFDVKSVGSRVPFLGHLRTSVLKSLKKLSICNTGSRMEMISFLSHFELLECYNMGNKTRAGFFRTDSVNHIWDLQTDFFNNPKTVVELHLQNVSLAGLPNDICKLECLKVLDVSENLINWLPDSFGSLKSLEEFAISGCKLAYLPVNFNRLSSLKKLLLDHNQLSDVRNNLAGLSSLEWLDLYDNSLDEFPLSPTHLMTLKKLDVADNYVNVEEALGCVHGESFLEIYCQLQANLRNSSQCPAVGRQKGHKISSNLSDCDSTDSFHKDYSDYEDNAYSCADEYKEGISEQVEENWDEDSDDAVSDQFDPNMISRYYIQPGYRPFGWTPPKKEYEFKVPLSLLIRGFIYVPGEAHSSPRRFMADIQSLPIVDGQFDDCDVYCSSDLDKQASIIECLKKKQMFVRNPLGVKQRRCTKCCRYDYCWHNGIWSRF